MALFFITNVVFNYKFAVKIGRIIDKYCWVKGYDLFDHLFIFFEHLVLSKMMKLPIAAFDKAAFDKGWLDTVGFQPIICYLYHLISPLKHYS